MKIFYSYLLLGLMPIYCKNELQNPSNVLKSLTEQYPYLNNYVDLILNRQISSRFNSEEMCEKRIKDAINMVNSTPEIIKNVNASSPQIILNDGYLSEIHHTVTSDGYILEMHRIPNNGRNVPIKGVVLLEHGLLSTSADWLVQGSEKALPYLLANVGYDVWLGNARGNTYSRKHKSLNPDTQSKFWAFSWHEIGIYDIPAMIDYILNQTNQQQLHYIGHSQGTTTFYVMCSERPEYNAKVKSHISLSPVAHMHHVRSPFIQFLAPFVDVLELITHLIGVDEFTPRRSLLKRIGAQLCNMNVASQWFCKNTALTINGFSPQEINLSTLPFVLAHTSSGASTRQVIHYAQCVKDKLNRFKQYDHHLGNIHYYGSFKPPEYELSKVTAPVYLFYSSSDWLSAKEDVMLLSKELNNVKGMYLLEDGWNHMDYLHSVRAKEIVYDRVLDVLDKLENSV